MLIRGKSETTACMGAKDRLTEGTGTPVCVKGNGRSAQGNLYRLDRTKHVLIKYV